ncbi:TetR/AcrR family transcriptional regulator C-terminal domain-containing protein [Henriciella aquimarina]|uniref:TetR/AcrR family transcriptional regulator C-terminal domain-containing protein n=1 Tax=Henriciella aquimarina TaxID=545261 RepID=UPI00117B280D|nr:TetR/AcrR family transcriptional regulator C-terminal domain-containing protein [Henriciella aquimarina]
MGQTVAKSRAGQADAPLNKDRIVEAALGLLDEVGLEGLSTRRLASELSIKSASLYWHFKNKDELLDAMCSAMFNENMSMLKPRGASFDWAKWLADGARRIRQTALSRRDGAQIMARVRPHGERSTERTRRNLEMLGEIGFGADESRYIIVTLRRYAIGCAMQEQADIAAGKIPTEGDGTASFEFGLGLIIDSLRARVAPA